MNIVKQMKQNEPLIHHLTNQATMNFVANGVLAFGASPIMAKEKAEVEQIASVANGIVINIGTIIETDRESMILAGRTANEHGIPVLLDPVGVAATPYRSEVVEDFLGKIHFTAIKGNAGEMAHLVDVAWEVKGVDSVDADASQIEDIALKVAEKYNTLAIVTGEKDAIAKNGVVKTNDTGHVYLTKVTGAGCLLGSLITACLTIEADPVEAACEATRFFGEAAGATIKRNDVFGPGTFQAHFLDALNQS